MFYDFIDELQNLYTATTNIAKKIWHWLSERWMPATAFLSGIASLFAAYASYMSYQVSVGSAQVSEQSFKTTNRLEHEARLAQRARIVVQSIEFTQTRAKSSESWNDKDVDIVGLAIVMRNSGRNVVSALRMKVGT